LLMKEPPSAGTALSAISLIVPSSSSVALTECSTTHASTSTHAPESPSAPLPRGSTPMRARVELSNCTGKLSASSRIGRTVSGKSSTRTYFCVISLS